MDPKASIGPTLLPGQYVQRTYIFLSHNHKLRIVVGVSAGSIVTADYIDGSQTTSITSSSNSDIDIVLFKLAVKTVCRFLTERRLVGQESRLQVILQDVERSLITIRNNNRSSTSTIFRHYYFQSTTSTKNNLKKSRNYNLLRSSIEHVIRFSLH